MKPKTGATIRVRAHRTLDSRKTANQASQANRVLVLPGKVSRPKTRNISLTSELDTQIEQRVRSGLYGNASDVVRAGLRALLREEMAERYQQFKGIMATLPRDPVTPGIEQDIERQVKAGRAADTKRAAQLARP